MGIAVQHDKGSLRQMKRGDAPCQLHEAHIGAEAQHVSRDHPQVVIVGLPVGGECDHSHIQEKKCEKIMTILKK